MQTIVPLKQIEHGFGYIRIRSPYTLYSIYLRGTIYDSFHNDHCRDALVSTCLNLYIYEPLHPSTPNPSKLKLLNPEPLSPLPGPLGGSRK